MPTTNSFQDRNRENTHLTVNEASDYSLVPLVVVSICIYWIAVLVVVTVVSAE